MATVRLQVEMDENRLKELESLHAGMRDSNKERFNQQCVYALQMGCK